MSEVRFARLALAHRNMWFERRKDKKMGDAEPLIPGWPCGHPWHGAAAVLHSVTKGKSNQWNLKLDSTPRKLFH